MGRLEVSCRRFAILSGVEQDPGGYAICVHPTALSLQRKGTLAIITEAAGSYSALDAEACRLAQGVVVESYFGDSSLSLTSSLLNALDNANTALLQYNYASHDSLNGGAGESGTQSNGTRSSRRAKVGATAILIRPDGAGIYLSQMAPTQAYVYHSGILSAIPEPASWKASPQHSIAMISSANGAFGAGLAQDEGEDDLLEQPETNVPAPSLGSGPGVEADLVYRRVEAGDMVAVISTSLSQYVDRSRMEQLLSRYDADNVINALRSIAIDNGLAEAHACVLELGVLDSSGVESDFERHGEAEQGNQAAGNTSTEAAPHGLQRPAMPALKEVLRAPREWLQRRRLEPDQAGMVPAQEADWQDADVPVENAEAQNALAEGDEQFPTDSADGISEASEADDEELFWSKQPTQRFPQRPVDLPPYKMGQSDDPQKSSLFWDNEDENELNFDGWEDAPPALDFPEYEVPQRVLFKPKTFVYEPQEQVAMPFDEEGDEVHEAEQPETPQSYTTHTRIASIPPLSANGHGPSVKIGAQTLQKVDFRSMAGSASNWLLTTTRSLIPDRIGAGVLTSRGIKIGKTIPLRWVIAAALALAGLLFVVSVMSLVGGGQKAAAQNILQQAQQMETLANQPGLLAADRLQKLQLALQKAQEVQTANPQSTEAKLLVTKIQNEIDQAEGITRLGSVKLLFDLDKIDQAGAAGVAASSPVSATAAQKTVSNTLPLNDIIVQGDNAYVLDRGTSKLYKCQIAASTCSAILKQGDSEGGLEVGTLVGMTMRVDGPVVIDNKLVSYVLSADTGTWQAQTLGGSDALQMPKDIATYDGNLYLLGARPGQISKFPSGQYDQASINWIQDQATIDAMMSPVALAVDGEIYVALADGTILTMQGGKLDQTLKPNAAPGQGVPTRIFTGTDVKDLYVLRADDGTITHLSKDGNVIATLKAPAGTGLDKLSGMTVDEGKGLYYLVEGRKIYQAALATPSAPATNTNTSGETAATGPAAQPTIAP